MTRRFCSALFGLVNHTKQRLEALAENRPTLTCKRRDHWVWIRGVELRCEHRRGHAGPHHINAIEGDWGVS